LLFLIGSLTFSQSSEIEIQYTVKNTGKYKGDEVLQGEFEIQIGSSLEDIQLIKSFSVE